jgi:PHD/YefM family antitoxin component YafN of YafNO toxin-antitoxin module
MATTTVSLEEIRRVADEVGEASDNGPVYVTRPGKSPLVLLTVNEYRKLSGEQESPIETPENPETRDIPFDRSRMTIEEYRKLTGKLPSLADMLAGPEGVGDIDFDPPRMEGIINPNREVDLSD